MTQSSAPDIAARPPSPAGPVWSAIAAAAAGCAVLGILTLLTELSPRISALLSFTKSVGDLSGVTTLTLLVWLVVWALLHRRWKDRAAAPGLLLTGSFALILIGLLGTFPPIADWISGK